MKENLYDLLRQYEFNKTEPETLVQLVEKAIEKGSEARKELGFLRQAARQLIDSVVSANLIRFIKPVALAEEIQNKATVGIDGSFVPVGGVGGRWYVPLSCATVLFPTGIGSSPEVLVESGIEIVTDMENLNPSSQAACKEMALETKAIMKFGSNFRDSVLFIDGPIVDPPFYKDSDYIQFRCSALKTCLRNLNTVIGCAKRVRDSFFKKYATQELPDYRVHFDKFPTDLQLLLFLFSELWRDASYREMMLLSKPINASELGPEIYKSYELEGIRVFSMFIQVSNRAHLWRFDLPTLASETAAAGVDEEQIAQLARLWSYPGQHIPLPIFLADEKCRIRTGCAEVLYDEIMTKASTADPIDQIVLTQLR